MADQPLYLPPFFSIYSISKNPISLSKLSSQILFWFNPTKNLIFLLISLLCSSPMAVSSSCFDFAFYVYVCLNPQKIRIFVAINCFVQRLWLYGRSENEFFFSVWFCYCIGQFFSHRNWSTSFFLFFFFSLPPLQDGVSFLLSIYLFSSSWLY